MIINVRGMAGRGTKPVPATHPKTMVSRQAKMAGGMFRSWASAIVLRIVVSAAWMISCHSE